MYCYVTDSCVKSSIYTVVIVGSHFKSHTLSSVRRRYLGNTDGGYFWNVEHSVDARQCQRLPRKPDSASRYRSVRASSKGRAAPDGWSRRFEPEKLRVVCYAQAQACDIKQLDAGRGAQENGESLLYHVSRQNEMYEGHKTRVHQTRRALLMFVRSCSEVCDWF